MKKLTYIYTALGLALACSVAQAAPVAISGKVINGSTNKPWVNGKVELVQLTDKGQHNQVKTVATDATGKFTFPAANYKADSLMVVSAKHQGVGYWHVAFAGGQAAKADFKVFDASTSALPLTFMAHHLAISTSPTGLKCVERIVARNGNHKTMMGVGPNKVTVLLNLPAGAKDVKLDPKTQDGKLFKTDAGWGVAKRILPDEYSPTGEGFRPDPIIINYQMDWPSAMPWDKKLNFSRRVSYPTSFFFVAREESDKDLKVEAPLLSADQSQPVPIDGKEETRLVNAVGMPMGPPSLKADQDLVISVSRPVNPIVYGFAGITLAICLFIPLAMARPKGGKGKNGKSAEPGLAGIVYGQTSTIGGNSEYSLNLGRFGTNFAFDAESRELIEKIANLDDLFEAGKIAEPDYKTQRSAWKSRLIELLGSSPQT